MPYNNVSPLNQQILDTKNIESTGDIFQGLRFAIPLATAALCLLNFNQSALAIDIDAQIATDKVEFSYSSLTPDRGDIDRHDDVNIHGDRGFLPRILSLIASPFKNHFSGIFAVNQHPKEFKTTPNFNAMGGSLVQDLAPMYLSQAQSSSSQEFLTATKIKAIEPVDKPVDKTVLSKTNVNVELYKVQPGDTVGRIANKYQVSRQELIALNKIQNSNVIFVNQKLKIPTTNANRFQAEKMTLTKVNFPQNASQQENSSGYIADSKLGSGSISRLERKTSAKELQDERLANLRAEIDQMRAEIKRERKGENEVSEVENIDVASSTNAAKNQNSDSVLQESVSLKLPPLPSSEEYLPEAFDGYSWPAQGVLSSGYGWRWGRLHKGIDIAAPVGTPIFAAAAGEVVSAGWNSGGYGNLIKLEHLDGSITVYAHNNRILVNNGQRVNQGEQIAEMGNTGFSTGSHLHFEIHSRNRGVVNPLALLSK